MRLRVWTLVGAVLSAVTARARALEQPFLPLARASEAVQLEAAAVPWLAGVSTAQLAMVACRPTCAPIPWQLDERDDAGQFVLEHGDSGDALRNTLAANDLILLMASDAGERVSVSALPPGSVSATEVEIADPLSDWRGWAYLVRFAAAAPQSSIRYVHYDPAADRLDGGRVALGFAGGMPRLLALIGADREGKNLLDRMKIRASASFLWGLITVRRNEDDVLTLPVQWHDGPIRIIRRQRLWIRLTWRWRTPVFVADTIFYRDSADIPVTLHLNFRPRLVFGDVAIRVSLDFRDLDGWDLETADASDGLRRIRIDGHMTAEKSALGQLDGRWVALRGPNVTLLQTLTLSPSLSAVRPRLYYRESPAGDPPESVSGALPDVGYTLTAWDQVDRGDHWFAVHAFALPPEQRVDDFIAARAQPLRATARPIER